MIKDMFLRWISKFTNKPIARGYGLSTEPVTKSKRKRIVYVPKPNNFYKIRSNLGMYEYRSSRVNKAGVTEHVLESVIDERELVINADAFNMLFAELTVKVQFNFERPAQK